MTAIDFKSERYQLDNETRELLRRASAARLRIQRAYPGVVGVILEESLDSWIELGYRFGGNARISRLVDDIQARLNSS
jgi:hypothetical protein